MTDSVLVARLLYHAIVTIFTGIPVDVIARYSCQCSLGKTDSTVAFKCELEIASSRLVIIDRYPGIDNTVDVGARGIFNRNLSCSLSILLIVSKGEISERTGSCCYPGIV